MHRRQILRRIVVTGAIVGLVVLLTFVSLPIARQIRTIWLLRASGFNVDWQLDGENWTSGGVSFVNFKGGFSFVNFSGQSAQLRPHHEEVALLTSLLHVESLNLAEWDVMEESLAPLHRLGELRELNLSRLDQFRHGGIGPPGLGDGCLEPIRGLTQLETLSLSGNRITDGGLALVVQHPALEYLDLDVTDVTDAGLIQLAAIKQLKSVSLGGTKVTPEGIKKLQAVMPDVEINMELNPELEQAVRNWRSAKP
jgi:hypothetical protein